MQRPTILGAKVILALALAISLLTQVLFIPLMAAEAVREFPEVAYLKWPGIIGCVAIVACVQLAMLSVWRLLSMVQASRIFQPSAFGPVNLIIACFLAVAVLCGIAFGILSLARAMPPGVLVLLILGALSGIGLALLMVVMRALLRQASLMEHDLAGVI